MKIKLSNLNNDLEIFLNLTLEETTPLAVCKHIRENVGVSKLRFKGCHFNAVVNNADFFSGHIYSDGGTMYWGTIQQRSNSIDKCQLYKYFCSGGADTVIPFKKGDELSIGTTATSADITQGKTALCNGVLVTGTRPAPSSLQSGKFSFSSASYETITRTIYFDPEFDTTPKVTYTLSGGRMSMSSVEVFRTHVIFKILHSHGNDHHTGTVVWSATA